MEGKVVFEGVTEKGLPITLRYPKKEDLELLYNFINTISKERTFIHFQGEEISFKDEIEWLTKRLKDIEDHKAVHLLAFSEDKHVGGSDIFLKDFTFSHEGVFGIIVVKEYRDQGVGKLLMKYVFDEALKNLPNLHHVTLVVFEDNTKAIGVYKKFGFQEYGRLPEGVFRGGEYSDCIYMYKKVK